MATTTKMNYLILLNCFLFRSTFPTISSDAPFFSNYNTLIDKCDRIVTQHHRVVLINPVTDGPI
jgi:hypothetical protein